MFALQREEYEMIFFRLRSKKEENSLTGCVAILSASSKADVRLGHGEQSPGLGAEVDAMVTGEGQVVAVETH